LRAPALVGRMFRRMMDDGCSAFVEIGGRLTMGETIIRQAGADKRVVALPSMQRGEPAGAVMEQTHARLRELGVPGA
jgi:acyl transferase domain-containing protein